MIGDYITYPEQLKLPEWKEKRDTILKRDSFRCTRCGHSPTFIQFGDMFLGYDSNCKTIDSKGIQHIKLLTREEHKQLFGYSSIEIRWPRISPEGSNNYGPIAMTDNGIMILLPMSIDECESLEKHSLEERRAKLNQIAIISLRSGESYNSFIPKGYNYEKMQLKVPFISDYRINLNVHHKYYLFSAKAWQYPDEALITLCEHCHMQVHEEAPVKIYTYDANNQRIEMNYTPCQKCHGAGYFPQWNHVEHGICFRCYGARYEELIQHH